MDGNRHNLLSTCETSGCSAEILGMPEETRALTENQDEDPPELSNESAVYSGEPNRTLSELQVHLERVISKFEQKTNTSDKFRLIKNYQEKVEPELRSCCTTILRLLDKCLIANALNPESSLLSENGD